MKKLIITASMSLMLLSSVFSLSFKDIEKIFLPEYKGDLKDVEYKVIADSETDLIIEIEGVTYIYKLK